MKGKSNNCNLTETVKSIASKKHICKEGQCLKYGDKIIQEEQYGFQLHEFYEDGGLHVIDSISK